MHRHHSLARAGATRYPPRTSEGLLNRDSLGWMEKDKPFGPGLRKGSRKHVLGARGPEPPLRVGMFERIFDGPDLGPWRRALSSCQREEGFLRLFGQTAQKGNEAVFIDVPNQIDIFAWNAQPKEIVRFFLRQNTWLGWLARDDADFLPNYLGYFDYLSGAGDRMHLKSPPFCPSIGIVMMAHIAKDGAPSFLKYDDPQIAIDPYRPKSLVASTIHPVERQAGSGGIGHVIESDLLCRSLVSCR
jgi:hypothetical protein